MTANPSDRPYPHAAEHIEIGPYTGCFDQQLELVKKFEGLGGTHPLPGSTLASDRFARASFYAGRLPEPSNQVEAIASMFSVIRNAAQPFRIPDPGKPDASQTIWEVVLDLTNKRYVYESTTRPNIVWWIWPTSTSPRAARSSNST